jgi:hypothetical protein
VEGEFEGPSDVEDLPLCDRKSYEKQPRQSATSRPRTIIVTKYGIVDDDRNHHNYRHGPLLPSSTPRFMAPVNDRNAKILTAPVRPGQVITQSPEQGSVHDNILNSPTNKNQ